MHSKEFPIRTIDTNTSVVSVDFPEIYTDGSGLIVNSDCTGNTCIRVAPEITAGIPKIDEMEQKIWDLQATIDQMNQLLQIMDNKIKTMDNKIKELTKPEIDIQLDTFQLD